MAKNAIQFHKISNLELEALTLDDYLETVKQVGQAYEIERQRPPLSTNTRTYFAQILLDSNKQIIQSHLKGAAFLKTVVKRLRQNPSPALL
jgi:hypothetical protein